MKTIQIELDRDSIIAQAKELGVDYMYLLEEERTYFTKCIGVVDHTPEMLVHALHENVVKAVTYISKDRSALERILNKEMADVILQKPGNISPWQRYDIILSTSGKYQVVEVNSETPAGLPEVRCSLLFDKYTDLVNTNNGIINHIGSDDIVSVLFADDGGEDLTNACFIAGAYAEGSFIVNAEDVMIREDGIYAYNRKIEKLHTFYPMERLFADAGGKDFRKLYLEGAFELVNGPINLISQSKAFWAWMFENMDRLDELGVVRKEAFNCVPKYYFDKKPDTIAKPRLFREGVGIGDDAIEDCVYQEYVEQMPFLVETYEGTQEGYITLGVYCNAEEPIGTYCRFCSSKVTDYTAYFLPLYYSENEKNSIMSGLANSLSSWMM